MKVDAFDFDLPRSFIAEHPAEPRDAARLLEVRPENLTDRLVRDLPALLRPGDLLVMNDTAVIPCRLFGLVGDKPVEVTLLEPLPGQPDCWRALARPGKRLRPGGTVTFAADFSALVAGKEDDGAVLLDMGRDRQSLLTALDAHGAMPLPPYIKRPNGPDPRDRQDYQTVYARHPGAVAAPTAGLHFTPGLLAALEAAGIGRVMLTLHVGAGTFLPVKVEDTEQHKMHSEWGTISTEAADRINATHAAGGRVVAIGTTALRLLESAVGEDGGVRPFERATDIFITPGFRFRAADLLLTNFHLPRSTLFMLVSAFAGLERMRFAYEHAKAAGYRFYSYGDASLLHRADLP